MGPLDCPSGSGPILRTRREPWSQTWHVSWL